MRNSFKRLMGEIFQFLKYNLKIKYRKKSKTVVSNVIFKKLDL